MFSRASILRSTASPSQKETLCNVLSLLPAQGTTMKEVAALFNQSAAEADRIEDQNVLRSMIQAEHNTTLVLKRDSVVPVDWAATLKKVCAKIPPEGIMERQLLRLVGFECPAFQESPLRGGGKLFEEWLMSNFSSIISMRTAKADGATTVFHPSAEYTNEELELVHTLRSLGRNNVTRWSDERIISASLPNANMAELRASRHVENQVRLVVRLKPSMENVFAIVDGMSRDEGKRVLDSSVDVLPASCRKEIKTVVRTPVVDAKTELFVDAFLDPIDIICAALKLDTSKVQVVVCAEEDLDEYAATIGSECSAHLEGRKVMVMTAAGKTRQL